MQSPSQGNAGWLEPQGEFQGLKLQVGISGMGGNDKSRITVTEAPGKKRVAPSHTE